MKIFTPYRVCPLGAHIDHQHGVVTGFAIDKGVHLEFEPTEDGLIWLTSRNFPGEVRFFLSNIPERELNWSDFVKGAVFALSRKFTLCRGLKGVVEGTLPVGGLSSSAAVILTYLNALCLVNSIHVSPAELIEMAVWEEHNYIGVNVGRLDPSCEVYCRENCLLVLDTLDNSAENIPAPANLPEFEIMVCFSGVERSLAGSAYNVRVDECKSAAYVMKALSGMEYGTYANAYLRDVPDEVFGNYYERLPRNFAKRALHYYEEMRRVREGVAAWRAGDLAAFGRLVSESGRSSVENYETGSRQLILLHGIMERTDGIYGGRFSGAGFNGSCVALIDPLKRETIKEQITREYLKIFPELADKFSVHICKTANGAHKVYNLRN